MSHRFFLKMLTTFLLLVCFYLSCGGAGLTSPAKNTETRAGPPPNTTATDTTNTTTTNTTNTSTSSTVPAQAKCADTIDIVQCEKMSVNGVSLGCKVNRLTKKCVPAIWENLVEDGKCGEITDLFSCQLSNSGDVARVAQVNPANPLKLEIIGMCKINAANTGCEPAQVASAADIKFNNEYTCGRLQKQADLNFAVSSICSELTSSYCTNIYFDPGDGQTGLQNMCNNNKNGSDKCVSYADLDAKSTGTTWLQNIDLFCERALPFELMAATDLSKLIKMQKLEACKSVRLRAEIAEKTYVVGRLEACETQKKKN